MPTRSDFETAAELFTTAAGLINELAISAQSTDIAQVVRGGSLGRQVSERINTAVSSAMVCQQQVIEAAETCLDRAAVIADYEWRVEMFDYAYHHFQNATRVYAANHSAWFLDETGTVAHPGEPPLPPTKPVAPPGWAEVRRV